MKTDLKKHIIALLTANLGINIDFFGALSIWQTEDLRFRVLFDGKQEDGETYAKEYYYTDVNQAVDHFLQLREKEQLGYDFSKEGF